VISPQEWQDNLAGMIAQGRIGLALIAADRSVVARNGALNAWLPPEGADCCSCAVLTGMDSALEELAEGRRDAIELAGVQINPGQGVQTAPALPLSITLTWSPATARFLAMTVAEVSVRQVELALGSERRARRLIEEQLAAGNLRIRIEEVRYREIVETTDDFVLRLRPDLCVTFVNRRYVDFAGRDLTHMLGRPVAAVAGGAGAGDVWKKVLASDPPVSFEQELVDAAGRARRVWWSIQRLDLGGAREFQLIGRDVTVQHELRRAMEAAEAEARAAAVANERLRMARDLHDTLAHSVIALLAQIRLTRSLLESEPARVDAALQTAETAAAEGIARARAAILAIRSRQEDDDDPLASIRGTAASFGVRTGVVTEIALNAFPSDTSPQVRRVAVRVVEEALRNVERHAQASRVEIRTEVVGEGNEPRILMIVNDDGRGFDPSHAKPGHYGLIGIRELVGSVGGSVEIDSSPGTGTRITAHLPIKSVAGHPQPAQQAGADAAAGRRP
jgi:signal transduction histidine kinase